MVSFPDFLIERWVCGEDLGVRMVSFPDFLIERWVCGEDLGVRMVSFPDFLGFQKIRILPRVQKDDGSVDCRC